MTAATVVASGASRACRVCRTSPARLYMNGPLCPAHEPRRAWVDPSRSAAALRERRERQLRALRASR